MNENVEISRHVPVADPFSGQEITPPEIPGIPPLLSNTEFLERPEAGLLLKTFVQRLVGHLLILPFCGAIAFTLEHLCRYRVVNQRELRAEFKRITREKGPLLICSNHLTFIDSAIIIWALGSNWWYAFNYNFFSWNLPAGDFFKKKWRYRAVAYLSKCIFIHRDGTKDHKNSILSLCNYLLKKGEVLTVFPEGRRSRSGFFENTKLTRGVGRMTWDISNVRALCLYVRGHNQIIYSNYPPRGARFNIELDIVRPDLSLTGRERQADLIERIGQTIKSLEERHFQNRDNLLP